MVAVASLLLVLALSMLVVRIGSVALMMTGLSDQVAQFQSLSAFAGAGFTTDEAEVVTTDPARRNIVAWLIRLGSVGLVTAISSLVLSFVGAGEAAPGRLLVIFAGAVLLMALSQSRSLNRVLTPLIERTLDQYTMLDLRDYAGLLHLRRDYRVVEVKVEADSWLADQTLEELNLTAEGVLVIGVDQHSEKYVGAPPPDLKLSAGDRLIVYGRSHRLQELSKRQSGDEAAHQSAKAEHQQDLAAQEKTIRR